MPLLAVPPVGLEVLEGAAVVWALALAYGDLRYRRLPNVLTLGAAAAAAAFFALAGASPLGASGAAMLAGSGLALLLSLPGYFLHQLGAGDVKLLLAVAFLGGTAATVVTFAVGALVTVAAALACTCLGPRFGFLPGSGRWLPFGAGLAAGFIVAVASGQVGDVRWLS